MLDGLRQLESLYLRNNQITCINQNAFKDLKNLRIIDFSGNKLSNFNEKAKVDLVSPFQFLRLKKLNLAGNNISFIYKDWKTFWLSNINLSHNHITQLQVNISYNIFLCILFF